jgi:ABC-type molybdate transport system permease subunit
MLTLFLHGVIVIAVLAFALSLGEFSYTITLVSNIPSKGPRTPFSW